MAERSIAAVLKTVEPRGSWGSNPYFSAKIIKAKHIAWLFLFLERQKLAFVSEVEIFFIGINTQASTLQKQVLKTH